MISNFSRETSEHGAALLVFVMFFLIASIIIVLALGRGVYGDIVLYRTLENGKQSFYAAEAGIEDAIYRHRDGRAYSNTETFTIANTLVTMSRTLIIDTFEILASASSSNAVRRGLVRLAVGDGASFNFGLQAGNGGIRMSSNSNIYGNVFSNGSVTRNAGVGTQPLVRGDIVTAGPGGLVNNIHATGSVWANSIVSSIVDVDAYYQSIVGSTVSGAVCGPSNIHCHPGSPDQAFVDMPIPDSLIEEWKDGIETTGSVIASTSPSCSGGTYVVTTDTTLGNVIVECNLEIKKQGTGTTVTFTGPLWIKGNLSFSSGPSVVASSSLGSKSVPVIVDNESNRLTSSQIRINQSTDFISGNVQSYVVLISMNESAENGGLEKAIDLGQSANGKVLVYAPHGLVSMGNSISMKEVTGYEIEVNNGASIVYESGLMSLLFTGGPGGGFAVTSWEEVE
jgi:hypothetical protein